MAAREKLSPENIQEIISGHLGTISRTIKRYGVSAVLVGGLPTEAILNDGKVNMIRPNNGTVRDFDALGVGPDIQTIDACNVSLGRASRGQPFFPSLGLEPVCFGEHPPKDNPWTLLSGVRKGPDGLYHIYYGDVEEEIPTATMEPRPININGVEFQTLPKRTLRWRYEIRNCTPKPKDGEKIRKLDALIAANQDGEPGPENYDAYDRFVRRVQEKYPERVGFCRKYWEFDYRMNGVFSGSSWLYGFIALFRKA